MSNFKHNFVNAHRTEAVSMLDLAGEIPLMRSPDVFITGNLGSDMDIYVAGHPLEDQDPESEEFVQARTNASLGMMSLHAFAAHATMNLLASEIRKAVPKHTNEYTTKQEKLISDIALRANDQAQGASYSFASYHYTDGLSGETTGATVSHATSDLGVVCARELALSVSDDYVAKTLKISEMPESFDGDTGVDISQTIRPTQDETLREAAELFKTNGTTEDMNVILSLFASELSGHGNTGPEVEDLLNRFEANGNVVQIKKILEDIKQKAESAKLSNIFRLASPEMALPSAVELNEYKTLLSQMRS